MKKCKTCGHEISDNEKICSKCGEEQRNHLVKNKIILIIVLIASVLGIATILIKDSDKDIQYVDYKYGEVLKKENTIPGSEYNVPKGLSITFEKQEFISKEEMERVKDTNLGSGDVAALTINIANETKKEVTFSSWGFFNITINKYQLQKDFGTMKKLPFQYNYLKTLKEEVISPGESIKKVFAQEIPENDAEKTIENDMVKTIIYDHSGIKFSVELP